MTGRAVTAVAFATCRAMTELQPDDERIAAVLRQRGVDVRAVPWNGPLEPFLSCDLVWVRSTWDYCEFPDAFDAWLRRLDAAPVSVINAPSLMRWNARKTYLLDLAARGAPMPATRLVAADAGAIAAALRELDLRDAVVKPVFGAGGSGLSLVHRGDDDGVVRAIERLGGVDALVQPLIPEIRTVGELSLVFVGDTFSHAVVKRPADGSVLIHEEHGGRTAPFEPERAQLAVARDVLAMLPERAHCARVDLVPTSRGPLLMEVEVIEPELFVRFDAAAADRLADAMMQI